MKKNYSSSLRNKKVFVLVRIFEAFDEFAESTEFLPVLIQAYRTKISAEQDRLKMMASNPDCEYEVIEEVLK
jgi:hypothetical protein